MAKLISRLWFSVKNGLKKAWLDMKSFLDWHFRWINPSLAATMAVLAVIIGNDPIVNKWDKDSRILNHVIDFFNSNVVNIFIVIVFFHLLYTMFHQFFVTPTIQKLKITNDELQSEAQILYENIETLFNGYLFTLGKHLEFGGQGRNSERVSLYVVDDGNAGFVPFGRYSNNPEYNTKGRPSYPLDQGCIAEAWKHGWHFEDKIPKFTGNKRCRFTKMMVDNYNFDENTISSLNMKPCLIGACAIKEPTNQHNIAIIVIESDEPERYPENALKEILESQSGYIGQLVHQLRSHIATPSVARNKGF